MSALFICPRCESLGVSRRQLVDRAVFECRSCDAQFPTEPNARQPQQPTRKSALALAASQASRGGDLAG
jgi:hypothetical protein